MEAFQDVVIATRVPVAGAHFVHQARVRAQEVSVKRDKVDVNLPRNRCRQMIRSALADEDGGM